MARGGCLCKPAAHHGALTPLGRRLAAAQLGNEAMGMNKDDLEWA
jgi:hypothetical protein